MGARSTAAPGGRRLAGARPPQGGASPERLPAVPASADVDGQGPGGLARRLGRVIRAFQRPLSLARAGTADPRVAAAGAGLAVLLLVARHVLAAASRAPASTRAGPGPGDAGGRGGPRPGR